MLFSVTGFDVSLRPRLAQFTRHGRIRALRRGQGDCGDMKPTEKVGLDWPAVCSLERAAGIEHVWRLG